MDKTFSDVNAELKKAQQQLIEQEKLASLGQLIAGISHELKNPLSLIISFSDVSAELLQEIKNVKSDEERNKLLETLANNLERINHHVKRADNIINHMLDYSGSGSEKRLTDLNKLCDECLSLSFHGMRATNPGFNCELKKDFFPGLPEIYLVSQDISRVLLNIFSNAFYAVGERRKKGDHSYQPYVSVSTTKNDSDQSKQIVIRLRDNGTGIPGEIKEKIFNPFFTTKPFGKGTGLGLSISQDIISRHNGELKMDTKENEFTEFAISLPY